jgi:hypothetical protein
MPITTRANVKVYDPRTQVSYYERMGQVIDAFNAASGNCIRLTSANKGGDFDFKAFFRRQSGIVARRDPTSTAPQGDLNVTQTEKASVKLNRKILPHTMTADTMRKMGDNIGIDDDIEDVMMVALGEAVAEEVAQDKINTALASLAAHLRANAGRVHLADTDAVGVTADRLNTAFYKRGDRANDIKLNIMHSVPFSKLINQQITGAVDGVASVVMAGANPLTLNRPTLVIDSPSLVIPGAPNKYITLGLVDSAITIEDTEEELIATDWQLGLENIAMRYQGEYAYNVDMMSAGWDTVAGGVNPPLAALGTGANWLEIMVDQIKNAGGVALITQ